MIFHVESSRSEQILPPMKMSWVPITAIQDLSENLRYLTPEDVDEILNNLTVSRSYRGVTHYRLSDVDRALQQFPDANQNAVMYIRGNAVVISNGNNGNNGELRPIPPVMPPTPPTSNGGVYIYLDVETFKDLFRPCQ